MNLSLAFKKLQDLHKNNPYPSILERRKILVAIKELLQSQSVSLVHAINKDFSHRSQEETLFLEVFPTIKAINFCLKKLKGWMKSRSRHVSWLFLPARAYVLPQPLGVVGIVVPWNYPLYLSLVPAIYALAAGNRVMIKMSELSPNLALTLQSKIKQMGIDNFLMIFDGDIEVAREFSSLPFNHLLFTGSTETGKSVMKAASKNLTPITLELGGKSPALISKTMNTKYFNRLFMGKLFNAAQTCIAPDYLLIPKEWQSKIEEEFKKLMQIHYPNLINNKEYTSIISERHKQRLLDLVEDATNKGARVVQIGAINPHSNKLPLFLIFDVTPEMKVMQEEIFGPLLPILCYQSFNEAVELINSYPNPLALYYFGENNEEISYIKTQTLSGALCINETLMHIAIDDLPFGGVGMSGMGQYHAQEGFKTFSKLKPVFIQSRFATISWLYPPYGAFLKMFLTKIGGIKIKKKE